MKWTKLSCHDFADNQVCLQFFALAYNLSNFLRRLALPRSVKHWSLTTLREWRKREEKGSGKRGQGKRGQGKGVRLLFGNMGALGL